MKRIVMLSLCIAACGEEVEPTPSVPSDLPMTCVASQSGDQRCHGALVEQCNGEEWLAGDNCASLGGSCESDNDSAWCVVVDCSEAATGARRCSDVVIEECDGVDWQSRIDCSNMGQVCVEMQGTALCRLSSGSCTHLGDQRCADTLIEQCTDGHWIPTTDCATQSRLCVEIATGAVCGEPCSGTQSGDTRCDQTRIEECNGSSWIPIHDCADSSQLCTRDGTTASCTSETYCSSVASWSTGWEADEFEVLELTNQRRAAGANCDTEGVFPPAPALTFNELLRCAARNQSRDMHQRDFFDHVNPSGEAPADRVNHTGYLWSGVGENIAKGTLTPASVVQGWMDSDGHCANIMNAGFTEIGVGYYYEGGTHYWTQVFGVPR